MYSLPSSDFAIHRRPKNIWKLWNPVDLVHICDGRNSPSNLPHQARRTLATVANDISLRLLGATLPSYGEGMFEKTLRFATDECRNGLVG